MGSYLDDRFISAVELRRSMRRNMPQSEAILWQRLRGHRLDGLKFRRKHGIGCYIVDFYCHAAAVAVEIDPADPAGGLDAWSVLARRRAQDEFLRSIGVEVLRFTERDVYDDLEGLIMKVAERVRRRMEGISTPG